MDSIVGWHPQLPARAWKAWRTRGAEYAWHKMLRRSLGRWPGWKRRWVYADPRQYWTLRGGDDYFREQEGQPARSRRIEWMAGQLARYQPRSILEVGCGYGKLLRELRRRLDVPMVGVDFSPTQLELARRYLGHDDGVELLLGRGERLPFPDGTFDMVVTSAVILHNPPEVAEQMPPRDPPRRPPVRGAQRGDERQLQPIRIRHRGLVRRPRDRPGRVGPDPRRPRPRLVAVLRGLAGPTGRVSRARPRSHAITGAAGPATYPARVIEPQRHRGTEKSPRRRTPSHG